MNVSINMILGVIIKYIMAKIRFVNKQGRFFVFLDILVDFFVLFGKISVRRGNVHRDIEKNPV